ncbi:hypothetical protein EZY14_005910 [Kordia sp. TARA_039_SRF]|nr:hypothetical protein EZY14_005910 [Kordia sp. TARA_039_SRF]
MSKETLISEISAIQTKLLFLHFKSVKINDNIRRVNSIDSLTLSVEELIKRKGETAYDIIEIISLFEGYNSLIKDIYNYKNVSKYLDKKIKIKLGNIQKITSNWKHVRNKIGGHVDIEPIKEFCDNYNYNGVFISNNLEADFKGILILQMIESAINITLKKSKLFDSNLCLTNTEDLINLIEKINKDWYPCIILFQELSKFLNEIGKKDKLKIIDSNDIGLINFD